jgi:DNA-binding response OmpR family regulator
MPATILAVDDDWMNREMLQAHLENAGYRVLLAHNGTKALEIAASEHPNLILLDVRMPGMDGFETCAQLKASPETQQIPVLMITALEDFESKTRGLEAGAADFVPKPFDLDQMLAQIRHFIS